MTEGYVCARAARSGRPAHALSGKDAMDAGHARRYRGPIRLLAWLARVGCPSTRKRVAQPLRADRNPGAHARDLESHYLVRTPDVLQVEVAGRPACSGRRDVGLDGRISLDERTS